MKRFAAALAFTLLGALCSRAQEAVWSLDHCVQYAMEHNRDLLLKQVALDRSKSELLSAKLALLPTVELYINQYYNWGRSVDMQELVIVRNRLTQQTSGSVGASFYIFDGFTRISTIEMRRHLSYARLSELHQAELEASAQIASHYLGCLVGRLTREKLQQGLDIVRRQREFVARGIAGGERKRSDSLQIASREGEILSRIAAAADQESGQMEQLRLLLGTDETFGIICDTLACTEEIPLPDALERSPAIEAALSQVKAARHSLKAARGAFMPKLTLSAAYGTYYSDASDVKFGNQLDDNRNPSLTLNLSIPIFDSGSAVSAVAAARSDLQQSELRLCEERAKAAAYESELLREARLLRSQMRSARIKTAYMEELLREASAEYAAGSLSATEWLERQSALLEAGCEYAETLCKFIFQKKIIEYYNDGCKK